VIQVDSPIAAFTEAHDAVWDEFDGEQVDEEIVLETPPVRATHVARPAPLPPVVTPTVCRFASPAVVFSKARQPPIPRQQVGLARPRTLGEFLAAAKSRSDALLQTLAVRRRLVELNFQPRRSSRIAGQSGGLNAEMKAIRNLMRKLGLLQGDETPSEAALEAYRRDQEKLALRRALQKAMQQ
jgi:hypothetical protein